MEPCDPSTSAPPAWEEIAQDRGRRRKEKSDVDISQNNPNITCGVCDRPIRAVSQEKFDRHWNRHQALLDPPFTVSCPTCYKFIPRAEIKNHISTEHPACNSSIYDDESVDILDFTNKTSWIKGDEDDKSAEGRDGYIHQRSHFKPCLESKSMDDLRARIRSQFDDGYVTSLFLFRNKLSKQWPLNWTCSLCPEDKTQMGKYRNDISMQVFALRHLKLHCEGVEGLEGLITKEWKLLKKELHEEVEAHFESDRDLTQTHRSVDYYVTRYTGQLEKLAYELVRRGKQKMLPQALSLCLVCCNPVFGQLAQHFKAEHPELHAHGEISEFRKVDETPTYLTKEQFVLDLLSYTQAYKMKEQRSSSSVTFFKWRCGVPCEEEGHTCDTVELPSINLLRLYVLKHFATFHHRFFRQKFMDREWKLVQNDIRLPVDFISYNPEDQTGFVLNDPNSFCLPFVNKMLPKAVTSNEYKICGFCYWCGFKKQFLDHIRQHNYAHSGEHLHPNAALESLADGVVKKNYVTQDVGDPVKKIVGVSGRQIIASLFSSETGEKPLENVKTIGKDVQLGAVEEVSVGRGVGNVKPVSLNDKVKEVEDTKDDLEKVKNVEKVVVNPDVDLPADIDDEAVETMEEPPVDAREIDSPDYPIIPAFHLDVPENDTTRSSLGDSDMITVPDNLEEFNFEPEERLSLAEEASVEVENGLQTEVNGPCDFLATIEIQPHSQDIFSSNSEREKTPVVEMFDRSPKTPIEETPKELTTMETLEHAIFASLEETRGKPMETGDLGIQDECLVNNDPSSPLSRAPGSFKRKSAMEAVAKTEEQLRDVESNSEGMIEREDEELEDDEDSDDFDGKLRIAEDEKDSLGNDDMVVPKHDRSVTGTPCSSRSAAASIQVTPNLAEIPFDWSARVIDNFKYDGEVPALTEDIMTAVKSLLDMNCPFCNIPLNRPKFVPGPSQDEETVLAHLLVHHTDEPIARDLLNIKRCKLRDNRDDASVFPHIFLLDPANEDLVCSSCCEYSTKRLYNLRLHFVKCVMKNEATTSARTPKTDRNTAETFKRSLDCGIGWKKSRRCSLAVSEVLHPAVKERNTDTAAKCRNLIECPVCMKKFRPNVRDLPQASLFFHLLGLHFKSDEGEKFLRSMNSKDFRHMNPHIDILPTLDASKNLDGNSYFLVCAFCESRSASVQTHRKHLKSHEQLLKCSTLDEPCNICGQLIPCYGSCSPDFFRFAHLLEYHLTEKENPEIFDNFPEAIDAPSLALEKSLKRSRNTSSPVFCCSRCPFSTNTSLIFLHHFDEHHCPDKLVPAPTYFCPVCKKSYSSSLLYGVRFSLLAHFIRCHPDSKETFENTWGFEWSSKEFPFLNAAKSFEEGKFVCSACDQQQYSTISAAVGHAEKHHATTNTPNQTPTRKRKTRNSLIHSVHKKPRVELDNSLLSHFDSEFEMGEDENLDTTQGGYENPGKLDTMEEEGMRSFFAPRDEGIHDGRVGDIFASPKSRRVLGQEIFTPTGTSSIGSPTESNKAANWLTALLEENSAKASHETKSQDRPSTSRDANAPKPTKKRTEKEEKPKGINASSACCICDEVFENRSNLFSHIKEMHPKDSGSYPCAICEKCFDSRKKLRQHERRIHERATKASTSADSMSESVVDDVNITVQEKQD